MICFGFDNSSTTADWVKCTVNIEVDINAAISTSPIMSPFCFIGQLVISRLRQQVLPVLTEELGGHLAYYYPAQISA